MERFNKRWFSDRTKFRMPCYGAYHSTAEARRWQNYRSNSDIRVEENGLGFLLGSERWWLFLDGLTSIDQLTAGIWTLQHWNGWIIHIPVNAITEDQLAYLRAAMEKGHTHEAVIERGRRLAEMERDGQQ